MDSAFYFKPGKFPEGINNLTQKNDGTNYKKVEARKIWVDYSIKKKSSQIYSQKEENDLIKWSKTFKSDVNTLHSIIRKQNYTSNQELIENTQHTTFKREWTNSTQNKIDNFFL